MAHQAWCPSVTADIRHQARHPVPGYDLNCYACTDSERYDEHIHAPCLMGCDHQGNRPDCTRQ